MGDVYNPKASDVVPITTFYADRISSFIYRNVAGIVNLHYDLVVLVYVGQTL